MTDGTWAGGRRAYVGTLMMLAAAAAFPIALMVFNPTLMFERGWEQFLGTGLYLLAVLVLAGELRRLWRDERSFAHAPALLDRWSGAAEAVPVLVDEGRIVPARLRQLAGGSLPARPATMAQLMELNREASALDQEQAAGRFTLTRYILYLLPVIGFIGTVEGISHALMNISKVLPMVKDLDGFLNNLTGVTSALQIAFDSTLLALFLSAALMLVQTLVYRRCEDLLARVDRWVVEAVLPRAGQAAPRAGVAEVLGPMLDRLRADLVAATAPIAGALEALSAQLGGGLAPQADRLAEAVDRLAPALADFHRGAEAIGRAGDALQSLGQAGESVRRGALSLGRIEAALAAGLGDDEQLAAIHRGVERTCSAIESLSTSWAHSFERSSRATQEQLARTLGSLKDALDLLNVSMEQGNALYRTIIKKTFTAYHGEADSAAA